MITWTTNEADYPDHSFLYVSKLGNDANAGTKAEPFLTYGAAVAAAEADPLYLSEYICIVIGEGKYIGILGAHIKGYKFIGDGFVEIDGANGGRLALRNKDWIINIKISGLPTDAPAFFGTFSSTTITVVNCHINSIWFLGSTGTNLACVLIIKNSIIENLYIGRTGVGNLYFCPQFENSIINNINITRNGGYQVICTPSPPIFKNNIFLTITNEIFLYLPTAGGFNDHNLFRYYSLLEADAFCTSTFKFSVYGSKNAYSLFKQEPEFNNETLGDYSLKETSPCLLAGLNRASIGAYNRGWPHYSFTDIFRSIIGAVYSQSYFGGVLEQDIVTDADAGSFELESGHNTGTVVSAVGNLGAPQRIDRIESLIDFGTDVDGYHTNLPVWSDFLFAAYDNAKKYFEGDTITEGGTKYICILDYPNESPFVEYPPASSPTYWAVSTIPTATNVVPNFLFRYGNSLAEVNAAAWKLTPFKGDFMVDAAGKGSADPDYDAATGRYITFSRYQFKLKLKNL